MTLRRIAPGNQTREWSDCITPILIKELRQGTRETSFVVLFLLLQFSMAFLAIADLSGERQAQQNRYIFDYSLLGVFLGVLPLLSSFSLSQEIQQNTLETMLMTSMSTWWIVAGKWIARAFQSFLLASTILPYLILQYLNGNEELIDDLEFLGSLFIGNLVLVAITLGLSAISNTIVKSVSLVALLIFTLTALYAYTIDFYFEHTLTTFANIFALILLASITFVSIDLTVAELNPEVHNNPFYRRIYCLLLACSYYVLSMLFSFNHLPQNRLITYSLLFSLIIFGFIEGSRTPMISKRLIRSYKKWGLLGRFGIYFFMPGWPSALLFCLPSLVIIFLSSLLKFPSLPFISILAYLGSLLIPLILYTIGLTRFAVPGFVVLGFNFVSVILIAGLANPFRHSIYQTQIVLLFVPCFATLSTLIDSDSVPCAAISCGIMICIIYLLATPWLKKMNQAWNDVSVGT